MTTYLRIIHAGRLLDTVRAPAPDRVGNDRYYNLSLEELIHMTPDLQTRRRLGGLLKRLLDRATDPDREHPVIDILRERVFPMLMQYLTTQLPIWLATIAADDDEPTVA